MAPAAHLVAPERILVLVFAADDEVSAVIEQPTAIGRTDVPIFRIGMTRLVPVGIELATLELGVKQDVVHARDRP